MALVINFFTGRTHAHTHARTHERARACGGTHLSSLEEENSAQFIGVAWELVMLCWTAMHRQTHTLKPIYTHTQAHTQTRAHTHMEIFPNNPLDLDHSLSQDP